MTDTTKTTTMVDLHKELRKAIIDTFTKDPQIAFFGWRTDGYYGKSPVVISPDGSRVAITGNGMTDEGILNIQGIFIFSKQEDGTWVKEAKLNIAEMTDCLFGYSADFNQDGSRIAIGAPMANYSDIPAVGAVYVFNRVNNVWYGEDKLQPSNKVANGRFGLSVSISPDGKKITATSDLNQADNKNILNLTTTFFKIGNTWMENKSDRIATKTSVADLPEELQDAIIEMSVEDPKVSLSPEVISPDGNRAAVIDHKYSDGGNIIMHDILIFSKRVDGTWVKEDKLTVNNGTAYLFANSVDFNQDGSRIAIGAPMFNYCDIPAVGVVYIFNRVGNRWHKEDGLSPSDKIANGRFGSVVSISPNGEKISVASGFSSTATFFKVGAIWIENKSDQIKLKTTDAILPSAIKDDAELLKAYTKIPIVADKLAIKPIVSSPYRLNITMDNVLNLEETVLEAFGYRLVDVNGSRYVFVKAENPEKYPTLIVTAE